MTKHDKSRNTRNTLPLSHSLTLSLLTCWTTQKSLCHSQSHSVTHNLALSQSSHSLNPHTHSILTLSQSSQSLNLSFYQSLIHSLSTCRTTFVFMSMLKSHSPTLSFIQPWHAEPCVCSYEPNWKKTYINWILNRGRRPLSLEERVIARSASEPPAGRASRRA